MKSNEVAMSTIVFALLVANPADGDCFFTTSLNLLLVLWSALARAGGYTYHATFACRYTDILSLSCN